MIVWTLLSDNGIQRNTNTRTILLPLHVNIFSYEKVMPNMLIIKKGVLNRMLLDTYDINSKHMPNPHTTEARINSFVKFSPPIK